MSQEALAPVRPAYSQNGARLDYSGTGGELFAQMVVGLLLTLVTFGIYRPWFDVALLRYQYSKTTMKTTAGQNIRFEFTGTGGELFVTMLVGLLLTVVTFGFYYPWFMTKLIKFVDDNSVGLDEQGGRWRLDYKGTGFDLFKTMFVNALLTVFTLYLYTPWAICNLRKYFMSQTTIVHNDATVGQMDFLGRGGDLFVTFVVGVLLSMVTIGVYFSWFEVKLMKFYTANLRVTLNGRVYTSDFVGQGSDLFLLRLLGGILTGITLGVYWFWYTTNVIRFETNNQVFREIPAGT